LSSRGLLFVPAFFLPGLLLPLGPLIAGEFPTELVLVVREKQVLAFSSRGNRWVARDLMAQEVVEESRKSSHIAVVVTNIRVLGFSADTDQWDEERLEAGERAISLEIDGKVASVVTNVRALGFGARSGTWSVLRLPLR
jgi:hypothetical protein